MVIKILIQIIQKNYQINQESLIQIYPFNIKRYILLILDQMLHNLSCKIQ
jgi:hypothetical protein